MYQPAVVPNYNLSTGSILTVIYSTKEDERHSTSLVFELRYSVCDNVTSGLSYVLVIRYIRILSARYTVQVCRRYMIVLKIRFVLSLLTFCLRFCKKFSNFRSRIHEFTKLHVYAKSLLYINRSKLKLTTGAVRYVQN